MAGQQSGESAESPSSEIESQFPADLVTPEGSVSSDESFSSGEAFQSQDPARRPAPLPARSQPPATTAQPRTAPRRGPTPRALPQTESYYRMARMPEMFGDLFSGGTLSAVVGPDVATATLPTAGGARRTKIAENNRPLPQDRVFFTYNHFHNALEASATGALLGAGAAPDDFSVDRYTFGAEKTFCDGWWSVEVRVPFTGQYEVDTAGTFEVTGGKWGNLSLVLKRLLWYSECAAVAAGTALDFPTGSDVEGSAGATSFSLDNDAFHLMPYLGFAATPDEDFFAQGFIQVDLPLNGNDVATAPGASGVLDEQSLLFLDLAAGYWLIHDDSASCLTGLAPIVELHYTTTLEDTDTVVLGAGPFIFSNAANHLDVLHITAGLHAEFANGMNFRIGAVFPLRDDDDKVFDAEVQVSVNWRF
jgi:hypothetical protein